MFRAYVYLRVCVWMYNCMCMRAPYPNALSHLSDTMFRRAYCMCVSPSLLLISGNLSPILSPLSGLPQTHY